MNTIELRYKLARDTPSDINEHIDRLFELASECDSVVEGGVRYVTSTWPFILGCACRGGRVDSYCWNMLPEIETAIAVCAACAVPWYFHEGDWLQSDIPETDMLFIDTNHEFWQLTAELARHGPKARKYIVLHDTTSFGDVGADGKTPGIWAAIKNFIADHQQWNIVERRHNNNGLTVLRRTQ